VASMAEGYASMFFPGANVRQHSICSLLCPVLPPQDVQQHVENSSEVRSGNAATLDSRLDIKRHIQSQETGELATTRRKEFMTAQLPWKWMCPRQCLVQSSLFPIHVSPVTLNSRRLRMHTRTIWRGQSTAIRAHHHRKCQDM
jgi:hypothetical protein